MEDGSAAPVETILAQTGALGFYQKRLFFCSCFLQALTVSALIYASHCRPDLSPPSSVSPTATNGVLPHRNAKCESSRSVKVSGDELSGNETSRIGMLATSMKHNESDDVVLERGKRSYLNTKSLVSFERYNSQSLLTSQRNMIISVDTDSLLIPWKDRHPRVATGLQERFERHTNPSVEMTRSLDTLGRSRSSYRYRSGRGKRSTKGTQYHEIPQQNSGEDGTHVMVDGSTPTLVERHHQQSSSVSGLPNKQRRRSSKFEELERKKIGEPTPTPSSLHDVIVNTYVEVAYPQFYSTSPGLADNHNVNNDEEVYDYEWSDDVTDSSMSSDGASVKFQHRDASRLKKRAERRTTNRMTSTRVMSITNKDDNDVTMSAPEGHSCEGSVEGEESGGLAYLSLTYLSAPQWLGGQDADKERLAHYRAYCQAVGVMVGATVGAMAADHLGRRKSLYAYFSLMLFTHCLSGMAVSWTMLAVLRFLVGVFAGGCAVVSLVFPLEFIGSEWRDACVCSGLWVVGVLVISLELLVTRHWRYPAFISGGVGLPVVATYFLVASSVYFSLLAKVKVMTGNVYLDNSLPFVIDLPLGWSAVIVNRCLGRRWCLFLYAVASGLALLSVLVLHMTGNLSHMPSMLTGMAVFGKIGVTASMGLVFVIAVEMYPTVVRCMGVAVGITGVAAGFCLSEVYLFLESYHYTVPFVVLGAMMSSVGFVGLIFPETLYRPLPNILPCRHRTIPLHEGVRLVSNPWDIL